MGSVAKTIKNSWEKLLLKRRLLTGILAAAGVGIIVFYMLCENSCAYLRGSIMGIDLKYLGFLFMGAVLLLNFLKKDLWLLLLLSFGVGVEIFLVGYQAVNAVYCPFCLAFGADLLLIFMINFDKTRIYQILLAAAIGLFFFLLSFDGSVRPAFAGENFVTTFGTGPVQVRLYTDYFCGPCLAAETEFERTLTALVDKNAISLTFIDTPIHKQTVLYAKYFLYIMRADKNFSRALAARAALFEAARSKISSASDLESFLIKKGLKFKSFNVNPVFRTFEKLLREDDVSATPSGIIIDKRGKKHLVGGKDIVNGLKGIMEQGEEKAIPPKKGD